MFERGKPENCARCRKKTTTTIMSRFNEDVICFPCEAKEREHPDYKYAYDAELAEVKKGNWNFPGVGWPGENGRVRR